MEPCRQSFWRSLIFSTLNPFWCLESISPQICSRRAPGKLSEVGWLSLSRRGGSGSHRAPHEGRELQPAQLQSSGRGVPALAGGPAICPPAFPASDWSLEWPKVSVDENILLLCLVPASSSPRHLSSGGKSSPSVWGRQVMAEAGPCLTHPGVRRSPLHKVNHSLSAFPCSLCPVRLSCKCHPPLASYQVGVFFPKKKCYMGGERDKLGVWD